MVKIKRKKKSGDYELLLEATDTLQQSFFNLPFFMRHKKNMRMLEL